MALEDEREKMQDAEFVNTHIVDATKGMDAAQREVFFRVVIGSLMGMIDRVNPHSAEMAFPEIAKNARTCTLISGKVSTRRRII